MKYYLVGLSYKTSPPEIRGQFSVSVHSKKLFYKNIENCFSGECLLLSTCNRTELYIASQEYYDEKYLIKSFFDIIISLFSGTNLTKFIYLFTRFELT